MAVWLRVLAVFALALVLTGPPMAVAAQAGERTFPETGFTARGPFLRYWEANGGLAQQGLPISAELTEGGLTVQYFERARFELHPEHTGTPYAVLLGLLGRDVYRQRYPASVFTPTPIAPAGLPGGAGRTFPETGQVVPAAFLKAWERFGGLAQQGYPISGVFREGPSLVQYFERARFEHHPEYAGTDNEVLLGLLGTVAHGRAYATPRPPAVTTSLSIFADYVTNVGGDKVQVTALLGPDTDPHEFEATPQDAVTVARSQVFFANGLNLEEWLDVSNAMAYVMVVRDTLDELDPANSPTYDANAAKYLALLQNLDFAVYSEIQKIPEANRKMVTFHDSWPYFTARYGLTNFPVHQANPEGEISAQEYAELVDLIRRENVKVLFGEAGFNPKILQQLARDTGVRFVDGLYGDTLAPSGPAATYVGMMQHDVSLMVDVLK